MELYNKRILKLLHLLAENKKILSSDQLALSVGVSSRTVRSDLKELEGMLKTNGASITAEAGLGYRLVIHNEEAFQMFLESVTQDQTSNLTGDRVVPSDPRDRAMYIIHLLLMKTLENHHTPIDPEDLADELFISMSTLKKDIKTMDKILKPFDLTVVLSTAKGVYIKGDEAKIRYCISEFIFNRSHLTTLEDTGFYEDIFPTQDTKQIRKVLLDVMDSYQLRLTDIAFKNLVVHIVIMLKRFHDQQRVDYDEQSIQVLESSQEYQSALAVVEAIKATMHVDLGDEVYYLTQHLISSKKFLSTDFNQDGDDFEFKSSIKTILENILKETGVDLLDDAQLINGLTVHLNVALHRMRFQMNIRNEFLDSMKNAYPFAFELAVKASEMIERIFTIKTNENEIGFLAVHFGAALERKGLNEKSHTLNAIIVCASGMATAMLLKEKMKQHFQNRINIVKVCPLYEVSESLIHDVDLVLTTVPMEGFHSDKIIRINILLDSDDIHHVERVLDRSTPNSFQLQNIFRKDLYLKGLKCKSKQEVLDTITTHMMNLHYMNESTRESVFKREEMATTELCSMVAMPHALENDMDDANVAVAILDKPILWDHEKVQVILLLNIPKSAYGMWESVFKSLYTYLIGEFGVHKLMKGCSYEEFIKDLEYQNHK